VLLLCAACRTDNNPRGRWTYGISREAYASDATWWHIDGINDPREIVVFAVILATPFVVDTVLLPIAVSRDVMYP
jgi:hypothetical protein